MAEGADRVVGHGTARVPDHVGVTLGQPKDPVRVDPGVHTSHYGHPLARWHREVGLRELGRVDVSVL